MDTPSKGKTFLSDSEQRIIELLEIRYPTATTMNDIMLLAGDDFYNPATKQLVRELKRKGLVTYIDPLGWTLTYEPNNDRGTSY